MERPKYKRSEASNILTLQEAVELFNLSEYTIERLAKQCGAKLKVGRCARYKRDVLQQHLNSFTVYGGDKV